MATHGIDFVAKTFQLSDGSVVNCLIYDTCGQEKYFSINESYYKKADAVLVVYDISQKDSFEKIKEYYCENIKIFCKKNVPILLLGNKADREAFREVPTEEGIELAKKEKYKFKETSCLKNENVADAFEALIEMWNIENIKQMNNINNNNENKQDKNTEGKNKDHSGSLTLKNKKKENKKSECC